MVQFQRLQMWQFLQCWLRCHRRTPGSYVSIDVDDFLHDWTSITGCRRMLPHCDIGRHSEKTGLVVSFHSHNRILVYGFVLAMPLGDKNLWQSHHLRTVYWDKEICCWCWFCCWLGVCTVWIWPELPVFQRYLLPPPSGLKWVEWVSVLV
jgi:hypothetical protein